MSLSLNHKIEICPIQLSEINQLIELSKTTFLESHGHSADQNEIDIYIRFAFSYEKIKTELEDKKNNFHFLYYDHKLIGYSKIIFSSTYPKIIDPNVTKLERLYLIKDFYNKNLGQTLLNFNIELARKNNQSGVWLYSWIENKRAIDFYKKNGFEIIDHKDFKISANHSNPNYIMYKVFD